jgi:hypothetical protein
MTELAGVAAIIAALIGVTAFIWKTVIDRIDRLEQRFEQRFDRLDEHVDTLASEVHGLGERVARIEGWIQHAEASE